MIDKIQEKIERLFDWCNRRGDFSKHKECLDSKYTIGNNNRPNHITKFGEGYNQAMRDVWDKINKIFGDMEGEK